MPLKRKKEPVQSEPVLEIIRFERFKQVVEKALEEALKTLSVEKLESCYPNIAKTLTGKKYLELSQQQVHDFWLHESKKEFLLVYEERDLEKKLTELDKLIYDAEVLRYNKKNDDKFFPDQLSPNDIMNGKLAKVKELKIQEYESQLRLLKESNQSLVEELGELLKESNGLIETIETSIEDHFKGIDVESSSYDEVNQNIKELLEHIQGM